MSADPTASVSFEAKEPSFLSSEPIGLNREDHRADRPDHKRINRTADECSGQWLRRSKPEMSEQRSTGLMLVSGVLVVLFIILVLVFLFSAFPCRANEGRL